MSEDGAKRARRSADDGAAASGGGAAAAVDPRFAVIVHRLDCTSDIGWRKVMGYATPKACLHVFSLVSVAARCFLSIGRRLVRNVRSHFELPHVSVSAMCSGRI